MAGVRPDAGEQLRAVAFVRWRLVLNSLRSVRGRLNLVSRTIAGLLVTAAGLGERGRKRHPGAQPRAGNSLGPTNWSGSRRSSGSSSFSGNSFR